MKAMISIQHPAWAHQFLYIIKALQQHGDQVLVLAVEKDGDAQLLKEFGIDYKMVANSTGHNFWEKAWLFIKLCVTHSFEALRFRPDILSGITRPWRNLECYCAILRYGKKQKKKNGYAGGYDGAKRTILKYNEGVCVMRGWKDDAA